MMPNLLILARFSVEMDLSTAFLLYLAVTLGTLLSLWVIRNVLRRGCRVVLPEIQLYNCEFCKETYLDDNDKEVTKCPQCQSFNKHTTSSCHS